MEIKITHMAFAKMSNLATTLLEMDTVLTPDSVEWCPMDSARPLIALGTYQLDEATRERRGSLSLYQYAYGEVALTQVAQNKTDDIKNGILDMKWCVFNKVLVCKTCVQCYHRRGDGVCLALAGSDGTVSLLRVSQTPHSIVSIVCTSATACTG